MESAKIAQTDVVSDLESKYDKGISTAQLLEEEFESSGDLIEFKIAKGAHEGKGKPISSKIGSIHCLALLLFGIVSR